MFADATEHVRNFTWPSVVSWRHYDGEVGNGIAPFVIINDDGWFVTAGHVVQEIITLAKKRQEYQEIEQQMRAGEDGDAAPTEDGDEDGETISPDAKAITHYSPWWGRDGVMVEDVSVLSDADLAVGRLVPFEAEWVDEYPTFKDPTDGLKVGTSLCRLGFPFHNIEVAFDEDTGAFRLPSQATPPPVFLVDGVFSRGVHVGTHPDEGYPYRFIETSSPGLRGQSGGPIYDSDGVVWAIQSRTRHYPLDFSPEVEHDGETYVEHQFLNVGWGVAPETVVGFLQEIGVAHQSTGD